jgi:glycosyltransferase involved in cell wall biosynthesis
MLGVVIPAHNEERLLPQCLKSVARAACHPRLQGECVQIIVVADACSDATATLASERGAHVLESDGRCVGAARHVGVTELIRRGARWIACTDADSEVPRDWLTTQLASDADAFCGLVRVQAWRGIPVDAVARFLSGYERRDGHRHIHGANLGFSADAYRQAGGFAPITCHEDVALIRQIEAMGLAVDWSSKATVVTSARLDYRAPQGFGARLSRCLMDPRFNAPTLSPPPLIDVAA